MQEGVLITVLINVEQSVMDAIASGYDMVQIRSSGMEAKKSFSCREDERGERARKKEL